MIFKRKESVITIFTSLIIFFCVIGEARGVKPPPQKEDTYLYTIYKYNRQPKPPAYMYNEFKEISQKTPSTWTPKDSLFYAYKNVYLNKYELALSIFSRVNLDTIKEKTAHVLYRTTLFELERFEMLLDFNSKTIDKIGNEYGVREAFMDLTTTYLRNKQGDFIPTEEVIFPILKDSLLLQSFDKKTPPHQNKFTAISFAIDSAFRQFTTFHNKSDPILSLAFKEMADFQKKYMYLTNSFFYSAAAVYYNKRNKDLIIKHNETKELMNENNFIYLNFKTKFGKIIKNRYKVVFESINEKNIDNETINLEATSDNKKIRKDYLPHIPKSLLYLIGLTIIPLFVLIFVRTKK